MLPAASSVEVKPTKALFVVFDAPVASPKTASIRCPVTAPEKRVMNCSRRIVLFVTAAVVFRYSRRANLV
jgi:hypothetical protein